MLSLCCLQLGLRRARTGIPVAGYPIPYSTLDLSNCHAELLCGIGLNLRVQYVHLSLRQHFAHVSGELVISCNWGKQYAHRSKWTERQVRFSKFKLCNVLWCATSYLIQNDINITYGTVTRLFLASRVMIGTLCYAIENRGIYARKILPSRQKFLKV